MQYPTTASRLGAGLLRNPAPQVFPRLTFTFQVGVSDMFAVRGALEADTDTGAPFTHHPIAGGVLGGRDSIQAGLAACEQVLQSS